MTTPKGLDAWVNKLNDTELPSVFHSVSNITEVAADKASSAAELARVILHDPVITAKVLRIANSSFFNATGTEISTISHAVILLGFETVRNIALSVTMFKSILNDQEQEVVLLQTARSFHAAVQAHTLATEAKHESPEQIFIAALLYKLGEIAFLCFGGQAAKDLQALKEANPGEEGSTTEKQQLGFTLPELTMGLAEKWHLGEGLTKALQNPGAEDNEYGIVDTAHQLVIAVENGWDSNEALTIFNGLSTAWDVDVKYVQKVCSKATHKATKMADSLGSSKIVDLIPEALAPKDEQTKIDLSDVDLHEPDKDLQLNILQELTLAVAAKPDINLILQLVLEGIHRGVGMDRAMIAFMAPNRQAMTVKFLLDIVNREKETGTIQFDLSNHEGDLMLRSLKKREVMYVGTGEGKYDKLRHKNLNEKIGPGPFLIGPILVGDKPLGVFITDRQLSKRIIDPDTFKSFQHFVRQCNLCLNLLSK